MRARCCCGCRSWHCSAASSRHSATTCRCRCVPMCWRCRPGSPARSICLSSSPRTHSCASPIRRSRAATSIRCCRISASRCIRRCSISAMSDSRFRFRSPSRPCSKAGSMRHGRVGCGRGGWWFWDPVENASLMPWLAGTALLHSAVVMEKRNALKVWTILLAILTFSLSLLGTFLVRSGVLTSVHTFATDPTRGVFILAILVLFIGGGLSFFAWRAPLLKQGGIFAPISREGALVFNNLFLTSACATVFVGTLYPLALEALTAEKISVGAPFFNLTFGPLFIPLLIAVPFGPLLA